MKLTGGFPFSLGQLISNIHQQDDYKNKSHGDLYIRSNFPEVAHFSNLQKTEVVNEINSGILLGKLILGPIKAAANQAAEILIASPERAFRYGRNLFFFIKIILTPFKKVSLGSIMR